MGFIETGDMIYKSHTAHFGAHGLQHPGANSILITKGAEIGKELVFGVFEFDEDG